MAVFDGDFLFRSYFVALDIEIFLVIKIEVVSNIVIVILFSHLIISFFLFFFPSQPEFLVLLASKLFDQIFFEILVDGIDGVVDNSPVVFIDELQIFFDKLVISSIFLDHFLFQIEHIRIILLLIVPIITELESILFILDLHFFFIVLVSLRLQSPHQIHNATEYRVVSQDVEDNGNCQSRIRQDKANRMGNNTQ